MTLILGMAVLGAIGMAVIWWPAYPEPRHEWMTAMDVLADRWPHGRCPCGGALDRDGICPDMCARGSYERDR